MIKCNKNWYFVTKSGNLGWSQNETRHDTLVEFVLCQFCGHLGWFESLKWCQGKGLRVRGGALQWMGVEGGARVWGCRITCAKWHHEWRRVSSKSHSWCHLAQVILHPHGLEPLPQPHSLERPLPHWVETPLPWHHFRDLTHPRCPQNWHKTDETGCSGRVSFCDHPKFPDEGTSQFFVLDPILETLLPIFFTLWSSIQRQWPVRITSCTRHSQNAGNFFRHTTSIKLCYIVYVLFLYL